MKRKIYLVEYLNLVNDSSIPVGHAPKVLEENQLLFDSQYDLTLICGKAFSKVLHNTTILNCLRDIFYKKNPLLMFVDRIKNIHMIFSLISQGEIVWFTNVDWTLFFFLAFYRQKSPVIATLYRDIVSDCQSYKSILRRFIGRICLLGLKKVSLFVVANPELHLFKNQIHIPDYFYHPKYDQYRLNPKKDQITCLGSMRGTKDLLSVVNHFNNTNIKVIIIGDFLYKEEFNMLKDIASQNIVIQDNPLSFEEYYQLLSSSLFTILPYKDTWYQNATSGILLESVFLNVIPIAPDWLLNHNHINGIGYSKITDLPKNIDEIKTLGNNVINDISKYDLFYLRTVLQDGINKCCL